MFYLDVYGKCIFTLENLCKRGFKGPNMCILCERDKENILYLFVECKFCQKVWMVILKSLNFLHFWDRPSLGHWRDHFPPLKTLPLFFLCGIWKVQNAKISENLI